MNAIRRAASFAEQHRSTLDGLLVFLTSLLATVVFLRYLAAGGPVLAGIAAVTMFGAFAVGYGIDLTRKAVSRRRARSTDKH